MNIKEHLLKYGYNLEYSYDDRMCTNALQASLGGRKNYKKFWEGVDADKSNPWGVETYIRQVLVDNQKALKVLLSGQIAISLAILNEIISFINSKYPDLNGRKVLELGGYEGWAAHYLTLTILGDYKVDVVDSAEGLHPLSQRVKLITSSYEAFEPLAKYDVVYSILGASYTEIDELIDCAARCIKNGGMFLMGIRVQANQYKEIQGRTGERGFVFKEEDLMQVKVDLDTGTQYLPVFKFTYNR